MLIPNHGLGYLAQILKSRGHQAIIVDCIRDRMTPDDFGQFIISNAFDVIGFRVYTFDLEILGEYLDKIPPSIKCVIAGGPHPSADPTGFLQRFPQIQFCFIGESEKSLPLFIDILSKSDDRAPDPFSEIPGICYRENDKFRSQPPIFETNLDSFGFPDWDQISPLSYPIAPQGTFTRRLPVAPVIITRGCPYPCTFCAGKIISGSRIRSRTVGHVIDELILLKEKFGIREFHIQDDNFTFDKNYVMSFCDALITRKLDLVWACPNGIRLDSIDSEMLALMDKSGCYSVAVGIESGTQRVLDLMQKKTSLHDLIYKVTLIRKNTPWFITGFFILGYPGETKEEMLETIDLSLRLPIDKVNYGILMPLPGTKASQAARECGWDMGECAGRMSEYRSDFTPPGMTPAEFRRLFRTAFIQFYARPRIIWRFIRQIQSWSQARILLRRFWDVVSP
jgi:anaerobic magnesium-protoporphyrin IX monomethyl ester cyclase